MTTSLIRPLLGSLDFIGYMYVGMTAFNFNPLCPMDSSVHINWKHPFIILVVSGVFIFNFYRNFCKFYVSFTQTV